jgi:membrane protein implicated in regulation of membrane protease activity
MTIGHLYLGLLGFGLTYALLAGVMGWFSDLGGEIHLDAGGHLEAGTMHPISGTVVATFITGFGAGGTVAHYYLGWSLTAGLGVATATGLVVAAAAFGILEVIFKETQAGSEYSDEEAVGREAEVITSIPAGGTGEVAYMARGQRVQSSARAIDDVAVARGQPVVIEKVSGATVHVRRKT